MKHNFIILTDSYKLTHHDLYMPGTEAVYSYYESRNGAHFPETVFFGLQSLLRDHLEGVVVTQEDVEEAAALAAIHFGRDDVFNRAGWEHIVNEHGGRLPLRIKAVREGTPMPNSNALFTVQNLDPKTFWLTNAVESLLTHVWYSSLVATYSRFTKKIIANYWDATVGNREGMDFALHDFGFRGAASVDAAAIGGAGHLLNFMGTDTLVAISLLNKHYDAPLETIAFSVVATEHSNMTAMGPDGEPAVVRNILAKNPTGILSVVSDSFDIYSFVTDLVCTEFKDDILARDGVFVVRPDSNTPRHPNPHDQVVWILEELWRGFGGETNELGFKVLDPHVRVLWGDGIDAHGIELILQAAMEAGFAASNLVFGMGGGLLQKGHHRDVQRSAFKCSAQLKDGTWIDIWKKPQDITKASKRGRLSVIPYDGSIITLSEANHKDDLLVTVFENGEIINPITLEEMRANAALPVAKTAEVPA